MVALSAIMAASGVTGSQGLYFSQNGSSTRLSTTGSNYSREYPVAESNTRNMLSMLQERISGFEKQVACEAANRKSSEENRMSNIKDNMVKLEKSLNAEVKRRIEGNKQLTQMFTQEVSMVQNKLEKLFVEKLDHLQSAIDSLSERTTRLERDFMEERDGLKSAVEEQTLAAGRDISTLQASLENEKASRNERENMICRRLADLESKTENSLEQERSIREEKHGAIVENLDEAKAAKDEQNERFRAQTLEEIAALKNGLLSESQGRERADDDIVQAINHYTKALQDALRMINTA